MKPILYEKLTKRFLLSLTPGQYLVSNVYTSLEDGSAIPCFREVVGAIDTRNAQWERIKSAHANGRHCVVLKCEDDYDAYRRSSPAPSTTVSGDARKKKGADDKMTKRIELESLLEFYVYRDYFEELFEYIYRWPVEWRSRLSHSFAELAAMDQTRAKASAMFEEVIREAKEASVILEKP